MIDKFHKCFFWVSLFQWYKNVERREYRRNQNEITTTLKNIWRTGRIILEKHQNCLVERENGKHIWRKKSTVKRKIHEKKKITCKKIERNLPEILISKFTSSKFQLSIAHVLNQINTPKTVHNHLELWNNLKKLKSNGKII